ncbi:MAG TPA: 30S ribosomal protein S17 [Thermoanaerobaculia bacterium]|nr:30S ribosomal protein S17 [Thermoanaerobaculia bacterium]HUM30647.1 30S ribosomal protein S17 [Thermoanaerobaculia bacterium]HXK68945.1 30S ribosomal protein S17 [Thermoanaerobaculia bacterium]
MASKGGKVGTVVSTAMDKTVVVRVDHIMLHPQYKKYIRRSKRFMAHDETNQCNVGDKVLILETRPLSKRKRWRISKVLEQAREVQP